MILENGSTPPSFHPSLSFQTDGLPPCFQGPGAAALRCRSAGPLASTATATRGNAEPEAHRAGSGAPEVGCVFLRWLGGSVFQAPVERKWTGHVRTRWQT